MPKIYVASFITAGDYDCLVTDGDFREQTWEDVANGFTCAAGLDRDRVIAKAKQMFIEELIDLEDLSASTSIDEVADANASRRSIIEGDTELVPDGDNSWYIAVAGENEGYLVVREFEDD